MAMPSMPGPEPRPRPHADPDRPGPLAPTVFGPSGVDPTAVQPLTAHQLEVTFVAAGPSVTAVVHGELLQETVEQFVRAVTGSADDLAVERLVVDLTAASFMDSTGLGALVSLRNRVLGRGAQFAIVRPDDRVFRLFEITHLDTLFEFVDAA